MYFCAVTLGEAWDVLRDGWKEARIRVTLDVVQVHRAPVPVRAALELPVQLRHHRVRMRAARERVPVSAMRRREDVAVLHRLADADRHRLLPDRDVEEAGQLAGAKPLLNLRLEPPDEEHLAEEVTQPIFGKRAPLLDFRHRI